MKKLKNRNKNKNDNKSKLSLLLNKVMVLNHSSGLALIGALLVNTKLKTSLNKTMATEQKNPHISLLLLTCTDLLRPLECLVCVRTPPVATSNAP